MWELHEIEKNNTKDKCVVKKALFSKIAVRQSRVIAYALTSTTQPRSVTVEKWSVFLQNASGNIRLDGIAHEKMDMLHALKGEVDGHLIKTFPPKLSKPFCAAFSVLSE